jgi:nicotinamidase-related amidase
MRDAGMMLAGSSEAQIVAELSPLESEHVVTKCAVNPSVGTTLHNVLATLGANEIVMCSVGTDAKPKGERS